MQRSPGVYTAGTIYGQIGTNQIVGAGTSWMVADGSGSLVSNIAPLDMLWVDGQAPLLIKSIEDDQHLTLGSKLPFGIPAGTAYTIIKSTVTPSNALQGLLQKVLALGTSASPLTYEAFDNGVSAALIGFADDGRFEIKVGATGADGSPQHPWHIALLIDPATGNVSATGLGSGGVGGGNQFWYITGKPANAIGIDGDVNFDFISGFVVYKKAGGVWGAGLDVFAVLEAAVTGHVTDAQTAATQAQTSAAQAKASADQAAVSAQGSVQNGTGPGQNTSNKVKIGWSGSLLKAAVDNVDLGQVWTDYAAGKSLGDTGYELLPDGIIRQWGSTVVTTDANGGAIINFPTAYPNAPMRTMAMNGDHSIGPIILNQLTATSGLPTKTGFGVRAWSAQSNGWMPNTKIRVDWVSLGY